MAKAATAKRTKTRTHSKQARSESKNLRISPRKLNLLAGQIRGKKVQTALYEMNFSEKRAAIDVKKALQSAIANAENNHQLNVDRLVVKEAYVGDSFAMRRFHARGRGRSSPVSKPFAHLTIIVEEVNPAQAGDKA